jgi:hypothetical protein
MPAYELRSGGDVKNKKQSVADLKYRRLTELNARLKEDLDRPRVKVSEAALSSVHPPLVRKPSLTAQTASSATATTLATLWFHPYGDRYATDVSTQWISRAHSLTHHCRSTSARTPTPPSSRAVAALSCNGLTTPIFAMTSRSFFSFLTST